MSELQYLMGWDRWEEMEGAKDKGGVALV